MVETLDNVERNLIEVAGLIATHPGAGMGLKREIQLQMNRGLRQLGLGKVILELVLDQAKSGGDKVPIPYLLKRATSNVLDDRSKDLFPLTLETLKAAAKLANSECEAVWRVQERLVENLSLLAPATGDTLNNVRDQAKRATAILSLDPAPDDAVITPFRGLAQGATVQNERLPRRPSGVLPFDQECLKGGLVTGSSTLIAGVINTGKSYLMSHLLKEDAFLGGIPLVCSLEDNAALTQLRWSSFLLGVATETVENLSDQELTDRLFLKYKNEPHKLEAIGRIKIWCPSRGTTPADIAQRIDQIEEEEKLVITRFGVDYIQNIDDVRQHGDTRAERLFHAANEIYSLAATRKKNAFIVSQAKGQAEGNNAKFLGMSEAMAESFAIGRNAHYLITMKVTAQEEERRLLERDKRSRINLAFKKNKFGPKDAFFSIFNGERGQWHFFKTEHEREQAWNNV